MPENCGSGSSRALLEYCGEVGVLRLWPALKLLGVSQVESLRKTCEKMSALEQEKLDAEKALKRLKRGMDSMKQSKEQTEKMEVRFRLEISILF